VNGHVLTAQDRIIANPNCSTIQLVVALWPLHKAFGLERVVVSTYQSVSGSGQKGVDQLLAEREGRSQIKMNYPYPIDLNLIPHIDVFDEEGYTREERKVILESRKIMGLSDLRITCTAVRVPVMGGHSEAVNIQFRSPVTAGEVRETLRQSPGVVVQDDPLTNQYPMPLYAKGIDAVFVGRIRKDESVENGMNLWVVSDNLRKGAATNAVQIVEYLAGKG
jgi:aspartate-semialdehyde dehydrogenase